MKRSTLLIPPTLRSMPGVPGTHNRTEPAWWQQAIIIDAESTTAAQPAGALPLAYEPSPHVPIGAINGSITADCKGKRIGILIVTYNAITTLPKVLKRIPPTVWANVEEIAVFDDASRDATYELAVGLKALRALPKLHVIKHERNLGYGGNQKAGYRYFIEKGFDIVVLLHGDGQYAPEILSNMYSPIVNGGADAVFGSRMMRDYGGPLKGGMPLYKYLGNRVLSAFENYTLGMSLTEFHSGYRAYNLHALRTIDFSKMTNDFHFDTEIIIKLKHQHHTIKEIPIPTYYGSEICRVNGLKYARDVARSVYRYTRTCRSVAAYPEFKEYFVHYPIKASRHSSHHYAMQLTGTNKDVLDLGCGEGFFAAKLKENGNRIVGVDALPQPEQPGVFDNYYKADLDDGIAPVIRELQGKRFDRVLLLDVLEHLKNPGGLLKQAAEVLKSDGAVVVSVPNVANVSVRALLLFGCFNYTERGILDRTHLRFFTRKSARDLLEHNGFRIIEEKVTVIPLELALAANPSSFTMKLLNRCLFALTKCSPGLLGYQIMFLAKTADTAAIVSGDAGRQDRTVER